MNSIFAADIPLYRCYFCNKNLHMDQSYWIAEDFAGFYCNEKCLEGMRFKIEFDKMVKDEQV